jgi:hypothetical protein
MPSTVTKCKTYEKVESGDSCWSIFNDVVITLNLSLSDNKSVDSTCRNLWLD